MLETQFLAIMSLYIATTVVLQWLLSSWILLSGGQYASVISNTKSIIDLYVDNSYIIANYVAS